MNKDIIWLVVLTTPGSSLIVGWDNTYIKALRLAAGSRMHSRSCGWDFIKFNNPTETSFGFITTQSETGSIYRGAYELMKLEKGKLLDGSN